MSVLRNPRDASTEGILNKTYTSTFKNDYKHCGLAAKADRIEPPKPAQLQHRENGRDMSSSISVERTAYAEPPTNERVMIDPQREARTNFKTGDKVQCGMEGKTVMKSFFEPKFLSQSKVD